MKRNRYARHDLGAVIEKAMARQTKCYVYASYVGYNISDSKPPHTQGYYSVNGQQVQLADYDFQQSQYTFTTIR